MADQEPKVDNPGMNEDDTRTRKTVRLKSPTVTPSSIKLPAAAPIADPLTGRDTDTGNQPVAFLLQQNPSHLAAIDHQIIGPLDFDLEAEIGAGYAYSPYDSYECLECRRSLDSGTRHYWGITKAAISLIYFLK